MLSPERIREYAEDFRWAMREDMRRMACDGEAVERWPGILELAAGGLQRSTVDVTGLIFREIVAVGALLGFLARVASFAVAKQEAPGLPPPRPVN